MVHSEIIKLLSRKIRSMFLSESHHHQKGRDMKLINTKNISSYFFSTWIHHSKNINNPKMYFIQFVIREKHEKNVDKRRDKTSDKRILDSWSSNEGQKRGKASTQRKRLLSRPCSGAKSRFSPEDIRLIGHVLCLRPQTLYRLVFRMFYSTVLIRHEDQLNVLKTRANVRLLRFLLLFRRLKIYIQHPNSSS